MFGNDQFTKILLHCDGTNASTSFPDNNAGGGAHTWTAAGNAQVSTSSKEFGTGSLLLDGTGDFLTTPDSADFTLGSGDWTCDFWFNNSAGLVTEFMFGQANVGATAGISIFGNIQSGTGTLRCGASSDGTTSTTVTSTTAFGSATWNHVAFVRSGNNLKLFINGTQEGGDVSFSASVNDSSNSWGVGCIGETTTLTFGGSIDEFRLSVGIARWTANFTAPNEPYDVPAFPMMNRSFEVAGALIQNIQPTITSY